MQTCLCPAQLMVVSRSGMESAINVPTPSTKLMTIRMSAQWHFREIPR